MRKQSQEIKIKGFVKLALENVKTGEVQMTDWMPNVITAYGFQNYIMNNIGSGLSGGKKLNAFQLATQTAAPSSSQNTASGELTGADGARKAATLSTSANGTLQGTASWATNEATQSAIGAVAWYEDTTTAVGTAGSIATFSTSQKTTDQTLSLTYQWRFS